MKFLHNKKFDTFNFRHPYLLPTVMVFGFVIAVLGAFVAYGGETIGAKDTRIVKITADNSIREVPTRAKTVGELLKASSIEIKPTDKVVPGIDTPIIEDKQEIVVYRSRPVIVIDGANQYDVVSAEQDPKAVAAAAGLSLGDKDIAASQASDEPLSSGLTAEKISVFRAIPVTAILYGKISQYNTQAKTVAEFLRENQITLNEGETTQPEAIDAGITAGMLISVNSKNTKIVSSVRPVPFSIETKTDPSLSPGQSKVISAGVAGERAVIYQVSYDGDKEVGRVELSTVTTRPPINEVRAKASFLPSTLSVSGDKQALMAAAGIAPEYYGAADYIISRESGWRPGAVNTSSGAYGLCQALPASKMATAGADYLTNPVTQLIWCTGYANGRYGGWGGAYQAWLAQHWW